MRILNIIKWPKNSTIYYLLMPTSAIVLVTVTFLLLLEIFKPGRFSIDYVQVTGYWQILSNAEIQQTLKPLLQRGFFYTNTNDIQQKLKYFSWVKYTMVKKIWPHKLKIYLVEHTPLININNELILANDCTVFKPYPQRIPKKLLIANISGNIQNNFCSILKLITAKLKSYNLILKTINIDDYQQWQIKTKSMNIIFNKEYLQENSNQERFFSFLDYYKYIPNKKNKIITIDLRYQHGFAIS